MSRMKERNRMEERNMLRTSMLTAWGTAVLLSVGCAQSDAGITTAVKSRFATDDTVKAYQIDVHTQNGVVTLSGTVDSPAAKEQAVRVARATDGVRDVVDQVTVGAGDTAAGSAGSMDRTVGTVGGAASDAVVTATVKSKMMADTSVSGLQINVDTANGIVTLTGHVRNAAERERAIAIARGTEGVAKVEDKLDITP
jgi:hyperosmotically inducible protein